MADAKRTIELVFEGVDKTGAATQAALKNTEKFAGSVQDATQPIADFTLGAVKLEAGLLAAGVAVTAFSVKVAGDFQTATADLAKVLSDTESIETYTDLAVTMSEQYGVASIDVLNAITNYKQAGFTAKEAGELTKAGLDLVIAGNVEAAESSAQLVASIKGFGAEASDAATIVDLLNAVSNEYAATTGQLLEGFSTLSPVAQAAGLSLQETIGILTPGIEVFQSGSEVANSMRTALLRLVDDSKPVQEGLEALGVSQNDANGELRSARDIYFDVANALQGVDENQKIYIASQLVGINRSAQFLAITDGLDKTLRIAGDGFDYVGSAAKEVALQLATAENATNRAKVAFTNLFISIGTPFLEEFTGVADAITAIFQAIGKSAIEGDSGIAELVAFVESQFEGLQATLETVANNLPKALELADFSGFINGVTAISDSLGALFDGLDFSTVEGLADAITLVGAAFNGLSQFTGGVIESFKPLFDQIVNVGRGLSDLEPGIFKTAGEMAGFVTQANILSGAMVDMLPAIKGLIAVIGVNQTAGLIGALTGASGGVSVLGRAFASAGLVGAAGAAGYALGTLANSAAEVTTGTPISTWVTDAAIALGLLDDEATSVVDSLNDVPGSMRDIALSADESARAIAAADAEMESITRNSYAATDSSYNLADALSDAEAKMAALGNSGELLPQLYGDIDKATVATQKWNEAAAEIELEEKLARIEAQTEITTAKLESDAQKSVAAFESISVSVQTTGDNLRDLYGLFSEADSISDKFFLSDQIDIQNERQQQALDLQEKLTTEQIAASKALRKSFDGGDATITVNGDGLQPHLEAMMFEVLNAVQVRTNAEGLSLLLGV